jgi:glutamate 5-kinase
MKLITKLGTSAIFDSEKKEIKTYVLEQLAKDVSEFIKQENEIIIVTSGAVGLGKAKLNANGDEDIASRQAYASIGQPILMRAYAEEFSKYNLNVAQFLLTSEDLNHRIRLDNVKQAYANLKKIGIPIVNENDTTAIEELSFGDNDILSWQLMRSLNFDILINYTEKGPLIKNKKIIIRTNNFNPEFYDTVKSSGNGFGGLKSKLECAELATRAGKKYMIAKAGDSVFDILSGKKPSTNFYI